MEALVTGKTLHTFGLAMFKALKALRVDEENPTDVESAIAHIVREWAMVGVEMGDAYTTRVGVGGNVDVEAWYTRVWSETMADAIAVMYRRFESERVTVEDEDMSKIIDAIIATTKTMFDVALDKPTLMGW